jgi:LacI family transcriptional regulator
MKRRKPTIKEVASHSGVSASTVSNVFHGKTGFYGSETAERVWASVRLLGYRPNLLARSLVQRKTQTVGLAINAKRDLVSRNHYLNGVLSGFLRQCGEYSLKLIPLFSLTSDQLSMALEDNTLDGVAFMPSLLDDSVLQWAQHALIPTIIIGADLPESFGLCCVDVDNEAAMRALVEWLIDQGHTRIGFLRGPDSQRSAHQREHAYRSSMHAHGLTIEREWVLQADYSLDMAREVAPKLLEMTPPLTAIVGANDYSALGVIEVCRERGIMVPEQMSIVGFDDIEPAQIVHPCLTTIHHPLEEIGRTAAELLIQQIESGERIQRRMILPGQIVVRDSTQPNVSNTEFEVRSAE